MAERGGFEPPIPKGYAAFRVRCIQPLCHLSVRSIIGKNICKARASPIFVNKKGHLNR